MQLNQLHGLFWKRLIVLRPLYTLSVEEARKVFSDLQAVDVAKLPADIEDHQIPRGLNGQF